MTDDCNAMQRRNSNTTPTILQKQKDQLQNHKIVCSNGRYKNNNNNNNKNHNKKNLKLNKNNKYNNNESDSERDASIDAGIDVSGDICFVADKLDALMTGGAVGGSEGLANGVLKTGYKEHKYSAHMVCERNATDYNMNHKHRGMALIFNHEHFDIPSLKSRAGTNIDCEELRKALKNLDFDVTIYKDCKLKDILKHAEKAASLDHSDNDCILIAILSHGELGYLYARDVQYKLDYIWHYFTAHTCPSLAGKPKLFFIQACQGDRLDPGVLMQRKTETDGEVTAAMSYKIPVYADFLIAYSTIPGFYSWRNTSNGSWFMQSLVHELNTNGKKHDILTLLTFVCQRVALDFESSVPDSPIMHQQKQIPCITTMLTRLLRFTDKHNI